MADTLSPEADSPSTTQPQSENPQFETPRKVQPEDEAPTVVTPSTVEEEGQDKDDGKFHSKAADKALARAHAAEKRQKELEERLDQLQAEKTKQEQQTSAQHQKELQEQLEKKEKEEQKKAAQVTEELAKLKVSAAELETQNNALKTNLVDLERKALEDAIDRANKSEAALVKAKEKISELEKINEEEKNNNSALLGDLAEASADIAKLKDNHAQKLNELSLNFFMTLVSNDTVLQKLCDAKDIFHENSQAKTLKEWR